MDKRISLTIMEVCQKLGIEYSSCNPKHAQMINDAKRLGEIFRDLKIIVGDLDAIADRNNVDGLKFLIHKDALQIEKIDHEIIKIAKQLMENNE
jgi:hypothetical protein